MPLMIGALASAVMGLMPRLFMEQSFCRVVVAGVVCDATLLVLAWLALLDEGEREFLKGRLGLLLRNLKNR